MTDVQQANMEDVTEAQPIQPVPEPKGSTTSGYKRLKARHRTLIEQHEALKVEHNVLLEAQEVLQADIDKLLAQHKRLIANARAPQPNWFEGANLVLSQLAMNPEPQARQLMEATLVGLLQRTISLGTRSP